MQQQNLISEWRYNEPYGRLVRHVDLDLLRTFQAVVETGSFASAAEQLGCTQPASLVHPRERPPFAR